mmetsp:Transcript_69856/g.166670  ORF Transcript_69856/g.166670 Transcript_69856/m.166670 type:complete len:235 (-) Transcript_69856:638-1342(-)
MKLPAPQTLVLAASLASWRYCHASFSDSGALSRPHSSLAGGFGLGATFGRGGSGFGLGGGRFTSSRGGSCAGDSASSSFLRRLASGSGEAEASGAESSCMKASNEASKSGGGGAGLFSVFSTGPLRITGMGAAFGADLGGAGCGADLAVSCSTGPGGTGPGAAFAAAMGSVGSSACGAAGGAVGTAGAAGPGTGLEVEGGSVGDAFTVDAASACSVALSCTPFRAAKVLRASSS